MLKELKVDVGNRFKTFRQDKKKAQHILAAELKVHQSTITNIEHGTTFPKLNYLEYFYSKYGLNINWMVTGNGEMYIQDHPSVNAATIGAPHVHYGEPRFEQYGELLNLMQIREVEQIILAKLMECKTLFKDEVKEFISQQKLENKEKEKKASKAKVHK